MSDVDSIRAAIDSHYSTCSYCGCSYKSAAAADACCRDSTRPWVDED